MTHEKAIKILMNERACVETDACDHSCEDCMLAGSQEDTVKALDMAIDALKWQIELDQIRGKPDKDGEQEKR